MKCTSSLKIDDVDRKILRLLQDDSKITYNNISKSLGIIIGTAHKRVKILEKNGIIKGNLTLLNPSKLGYNLTALIFIDVEGSHLSAVERELTKLSDVLSIYEVTGEYDIAVISRFKDKIQLKNFIKTLLKVPHIIKTLTNVALDVIKEDFRVNV
ncbi:Lrp/AsnC family transcriptional regulator [Thermoproteota archaeon]